MASDHGQIARMTRGVPGLGGTVSSLKYIKPDFALLAKTEGKPFPSFGSKATGTNASMPHELTLERTLTVPASRLGSSRGGSSTLKELLHSNESQLGRQPWEDIMPGMIGKARDVSNENSAVNTPRTSRLGSRLSSRPLTPAQQLAQQREMLEKQARGYTASSARAAASQRRPNTMAGGQVTAKEGIGNVKDWLTVSHTSSIGSRHGSRHHQSTGAINGVIPRVLPDKLDYVLQARRRHEIQGDATRILQSGGSYFDLVDSRLKPKLPELLGLVHAYDPPLTLPSHNLPDYRAPTSFGSFRIPFEAPRPSSLATSSTSSALRSGSWSQAGFDRLANRL